MSANRERRRRAALAAAFLAALGATITGFLLAPPARPPAMTRLFPRGRNCPTGIVKMVRGTAPGGVVLHRLQLVVRDPAALLRHPEIWIPPAEPNAFRRVSEASLRVLGTGCLYRGGPIVERGQRTLRLVRETCSGGAQGASAELLLELRRGGEGELALSVLYPPRENVKPGALEIEESARGGAAGGVAVLRGFGVQPAPPTTLVRADLLNHMWQLSASPRWIFVVIAAALLVAFAGAMLFPEPTPVQTTRGRALQAFASAFCCALALGIAYATLAPPLSGPDEPNHLMAFGRLVQEPQLERETLRWVQVTHLYRIRFRQDERFRAEDVGEPFLGESDPLLGPPPLESRSATSTAFWRALSPPLRGAGAPRVLLAVRLANALVFSLAVGSAAALGMAISATPVPQLLVLPFLLVPALPFFAISFSDVALTMSAYVIVSASLALAFLDGPRAHAIGLPLGLGCALMLAGGRSSWPLAIVPAIALITHVILGSRQGGARATLLFWAGVASGGIGFAVIGEPYLTGLAGDRVGALLPVPLGRIAAWISRWHAAVLLLVPVAAAVELALAPLRRRCAAAAGPRTLRAVRPAALALAGMVALSLAVSLVVDYPVLQPIPTLPNPYTAFSYVRQVSAPMLTYFRLTAPDDLLVRLFWGGFGWFDALPDMRLITALNTATAVATLGLLLWLARHPDVRRMLWLASLMAGLATSVALYALGIHSVGVMNATGRYMAGWHLTVLALVWTWPALAFGRLWRPLLLLAVPAIVHAGCLCFLLWRYF